MTTTTATATASSQTAMDTRHAHLTWEELAEAAATIKSMERNGEDCAEMRAALNAEIRRRTA